MAAVLVHSVIGGDRHLVAGRQPLVQVFRQQCVGAPRGVAVGGAGEAVPVPGVVDVHRVDQHEVRCVPAAQAFRVGEQVRVRIVVAPVEVSALDRHCAVVGVAVAGRVERRAVVQFADPVVGRCRGTQAGRAGVVEQALFLAQADHVVVQDAAIDRRHSGEDAFVERPGQRRQLAFQAVRLAAAGAAEGLEMPHAVAGDAMVEAVQQDEDDVVAHSGYPSMRGGRRGGRPRSASLHVDDHRFLPLPRQALGGFLPGLGVLDRLGLGVLLVG